MYYPKQIPYLLDGEFKKYIEYQEEIPELKDYCMCIWNMKSKGIANKTIVNNILPDACIDIVIDFVNKKICFAGFSKETEPFSLAKEIDYMGARLKPGVFYSIFSIDATEIMDHMLAFSEVEKELALERVLSFHEHTQRVSYLTNYLLEKIKKIKNKELLTIVDNLYQIPKEQTVISIAHKLGYNQKKLFRVFKKHYGVSPKVLLNILRLHLCLTLLLETNVELIDIAIECGFYDQSHFIKEIKKYTKISPLKLLEQYQ